CIGTIALYPKKGSQIHHKKGYGDNPPAVKNGSIRQEN
ncbi:uncharacterized protein METZ01_LOCUS422393, partial [marine metagenome]